MIHAHCQASSCAKSCVHLLPKASKTVAMWQCPQSDSLPHLDLTVSHKVEAMFLLGRYLASMHLYGKPKSFEAQVDEGEQLPTYVYAQTMLQNW